LSQTEYHQDFYGLHASFMNSIVLMSKKKITIEIDIDEILGLLKSKDKVTLELMVALEEDADETLDEPTDDWIENLPPEQREEMRKKIKWPFS